MHATGGWIQHVWYWFEVHTGLNNEAGPYYGFWSGFAGSFLAPNIAFGGLALGVWHHHNCHVKGCWRLSRHQVAGTPYVTCRKHHPEVSGDVSAADIAAAHSAALDESAAASSPAAGVTSD